MKKLRLAIIVLGVFAGLAFFLTSAPSAQAATIFSDGFDGDWNFSGGGCFNGSSPYEHLPKSGTGDWQKWNTSSKRCTQREGYTKFDSFSIKMTNQSDERDTKGGKTDPLVGIYKEVRAIPGESYTFNGQSQRWADSSADFVGIEFCALKDGSPDCKGIKWQGLYSHGTKEWFSFSVTETAPADAWSIRVYLGGGINPFASKDTSNDVWFDSVSLSTGAVSPPPPPPDGSNRAVILGRIWKETDENPLEFFYGDNCGTGSYDGSNFGPPNYTVRWTQDGRSKEINNNDCYEDWPRYTFEWTENPVGTKEGKPVTIHVKVNDPNVLLTDWNVRTAHADPYTEYPGSWQRGTFSNPGPEQEITINAFRDGRFEFNLLSFIYKVKNDSQCISISGVPNNPITVNSAFNAVLEMKNIGTSVWKRGNYRLASQGHSWPFNRVELPQQVPPIEVKPKDTVSFTFQANAPSSPGDYIFSWRMEQAGKGVFGDLCGPITVHVSGHPPTASISGSNNSYLNETLTYTVNAADADSNLVRSEVWITKRDGSQVSNCESGRVVHDTTVETYWCRVGNTYEPGGNQANLSYSVNYNTNEAGNFYLAVTATDSNGNLCSGNPFYAHPTGWSDCGPSDHLLLTVAPNGAISGYVYDDRNGNRTEDAGEPRLAGVTVEASGPTSQSTTTGASYTLSNLKPGSYTVLLKLSDSWASWQVTDPTGGQYNGVSVSPGETTGEINFGISNKQDAWFQTGGRGDVYAGGDVTIRKIGEGLPHNQRKFMLAPEGLLLASGDDINITPSSGTPKWNIKNYPPVSNSLNFDYYKKLAEKSKLNTLINLYTDIIASSNGNYYYNGTLAINSVWNLPAGAKVVILVNGNLEVNSNISVSMGSSLTLVVKNNIVIGENVTEVVGIFVADGNFTVKARSSSASSEERFIGRGAFVASSFNLTRDLDRETNRQNKDFPAEQFIYRPDLFINAPDLLKESAYIWREESR